MQLNRVILKKTSLTFYIRDDFVKRVQGIAPFIDILDIAGVIAGVCYDIVYGFETTGG